MPTAAEYCMRQLILLGIANKTQLKTNFLLQICLVGIKTHNIIAKNNRKWIEENKAIIAQVEINFSQTLRCLCSGTLLSLKILK